MTSGPISFFLLIQLIIFCTLLNNSNSADFKSVASMCTGVNGALKLYNFIYSGEERRKTPGQAEKLHAHTTSCPQRLKHHPHAARTHCYLRSSGCAPHQSGTHLPHALLCCPQHCQAPSHSWAVAKGFNRQYFFSWICLRNSFTSKKLLMCESLKVQSLLNLDKPWSIHNFIQVTLPRISWQEETSLWDFWYCNFLFWLGALGYAPILTN